MRWVYSKLYPLLSPLLHPHQYGGRPASSTTHATQTFLEDIGGMEKEAILAFDVYHAFDSPPKQLIVGALDQMGTPLKLLCLIFTW